MHLNKKGWGLRAMLLYMGILIIFLIIAIYYIVSLYNGLGLDSTDYDKLEERLEGQVYKYIDKHYKDLSSDAVTITQNVLKSYNLDVTLMDNNGNLCDGYAIAKKTHAKVYVDAYINCKNYTTVGYEEWRK